MSSWPLMSESPSSSGGSATCPCTGIAHTQASTAQQQRAPRDLTRSAPQTHMRQRTNAQALVRAPAAGVIAIGQIHFNPCRQVPIPCGASAADVHLTIALNLTVSHAPCPICEHVPACPANGGADRPADGHELCGMDFSSESPPVPARPDPRFMTHLPGYAFDHVPFDVANASLGSIFAIIDMCYS